MEKQPGSPEAVGGHSWAPAERVLGDGRTPCTGEHACRKSATGQGIPGPMWNQELLGQEKSFLERGQFRAQIVLVGSRRCQLENLLAFHRAAKKGDESKAAGLCRGYRLAAPYLASWLCDLPDGARRDPESHVRGFLVPDRPPFPQMRCISCSAVPTAPSLDPFDSLQEIFLNPTT